MKKKPPISLAAHLAKARAKRNPKTWVRDPAQCRAAVNERWRRWKQMKAMEKMIKLNVVPPIDPKRLKEWAIKLAKEQRMKK